MATIRQRTNSKGVSAYHVQIRLKGYPTETASFERLTDARRWAQATEAAMREGRHFKAAVSKQKTLAEAIDRYFEEILKHHKNPANQRKYCDWWKRKLGEYTLANITPSIIVEARAELIGSVNRFGRKVGTTTANRYLQALGHLLNVAMNEWEWISQNPVTRIKKYKEGRGRVRFLSEEERQCLMSACQLSSNPYLYLIVVLALSTGARKMEILSLKWADVDFIRKVVTLHETKNGERRILPIHGLALRLIQNEFNKKQDRCEYLFPSEKTVKDRETGEVIYQPIDIRTAWVNAVERAGITDFRFHDLRHSAASYLAMNGASLAEIAEILGHKTLQMVKRYAHLSEAHTSAVVANMNERIFGNA